MELKRLTTVGEQKLKTHVTRGKDLVTHTFRYAKTSQFAASGLTLDILCSTKECNRK